jgi:hypothetical protein
MRRKRFTTATYEALWEKYGKACWRCKLPLEHLIPGKDWVWGHIVALGCGGKDEPSNVAPECSGCNETDNRTHATPMAAKAKRISRKRLGADGQSAWSKRYHAMKKWKADHE